MDNPFQIWQPSPSPTSLPPPSSNFAPQTISRRLHLVFRRRPAAPCHLASREWLRRRQPPTVASPVPRRVPPGVPRRRGPPRPGASPRSPSGPVPQPAAPSSLLPRSIWIGREPERCSLPQRRRARFPAAVAGAAISAVPGRRLHRLPPLLLLLSLSLPHSLSFPQGSRRSSPPLLGPRHRSPSGLLPRRIWRRAGRIPQLRPPFGLPGAGPRRHRAAARPCCLPSIPSGSRRTTPCATAWASSAPRPSALTRFSLARL